MARDLSCVTLRVNDGPDVASLATGQTLGRYSPSDLILADSGISAVHARLARRQGGLWLMALARPFEVDGRQVMLYRLLPGVRVRLTTAMILEIVECVMDPRGVDEVPTRELGFDNGLTVHAEGARVRVQSVFGRELVLHGVEAQLVVEILSLTDYRHWSVPAMKVWSDSRDETVLRGRYDATLKRIRRRLKEAGLPNGLFDSPRGHGTVKGSVPLRATD